MNKQAILCVDDENIVLQSIKTELVSLYGHEFLIETAESGTEALEIFSDLLNNHYDIPVIISDYIMPGMKGDELLKNIHRMSPQSLTVILTGQAKIEGITNAINNANLFRYLEKPWKRDELKEIIDAALETYRRNKLLKEEYLDLLRTMDDLTAGIQGAIARLTNLQARPEGGANPQTQAQEIGQLSNNRLTLAEIVHSINKIKANMDSLAGPQNRNNAGYSVFEAEEEYYQANQEEITRITALINNLKEGRHE